jgi:hypothetical protein
VKFNKEPVTLITAVTQCGRVYAKPNLIQKTSDDYDILEFNGHFKNRHTLRYTATSVTSVTKFLKCPECNFKNIYPEIVGHHIKYKHGSGRKLVDMRHRTEKMQRTIK